jgi:hypothetical protein
MKSSLVGYTGFVGSNLIHSHEFTYQYNTKNIEQAFGTKPDLLVYAGVRAEKFLANHDSEQDLRSIEEAFDNIKKIQPQKLALISTIDVYREPIGVDEDSPIMTEELQPYGANRFLLEQKVHDRWPEALIVRLPGLFGENIKKNFIYDFIHIIPTMLKSEKFMELYEREPFLKNYYSLQDNGFYRCKALADSDEKTLKRIFLNLGFSALNFTDSRAVFQFYGLHHLWDHIEKALVNNLRILNLATEPVEIRELYQQLTGKTFENHMQQSPAYYDFKTKYDLLYGGKNGYIFDKQAVINEIIGFIQEYAK